MRTAILLIFQGLGACAIPRCEVEDVATFQVHRSDAYARRCNDPGLTTTGICDPGTCNCDTDKDLLIPSNEDQFPMGFLNCTGNACQSSAGSAFLQFKDATDYLNCVSDASGQACDGLKVSNVGAACFVGAKDVSANAPSEVTLAATGSCSHDVCCFGEGRPCPSTTFRGVRSFSCSGSRACLYLTATEVDGDLYCDGGCLRLNMSFGPGGDHCVVGEGRDNLEDSTLTFDGGQNIMQCERGGCDTKDIFLKNGACLHVLFGVSGPDRYPLVVTKLDSESKCFCTGDGWCPTGCDRTQPCQVNRTCPAAATACCAQDPDNGPDCSACCARTSTSTLTSTSTTKKIYPYNHRRNRRQNRRHRRQNRRNYKGYSDH